MARRKGIYDWEHEPSGMRRTGFNSTVATDWHQSTQSTFSEPSRLEHQRRRRERQSRAWSLALIAAGVVLCIVVAVLALWPTISRHLGR